MPLSILVREVKFLDKKTIYIDFSDGKYEKLVYGIEQWDIGIKLAITGIELDENTQVHFSMIEYSGNARKINGEIKEGILYVTVPAFILEGETENCYPYDGVYHGYAWVYIAREESAETIKKIDMRIRKRPKPDDYVFNEEEVKRYDLLEKKFDNHIENEDIHFTAKERAKLNNVEEGAQKNTVTGIKGAAEDSYRKGNVNITPANIGLENVDNTSDENKPVSKAQAEAINNHNAATDSHSDIRLLIKNISNALGNYYLKSQTYTQEEINQRLSAIPKFSIQPVEVLPTTGISVTTVYLLKTGEETDNLYTEYIYVNGEWEYLGRQTVDLSGYALKKDIPTKLSDLDIDLELGTVKTVNGAEPDENGNIEVQVGVQSDLSVNDKTDPRYVHGRLAWVENEERVLLEETTFTKLDNGMFGTLVDFKLVVGDPYIIKWQGVEYECVAFEELFNEQEGIGVGNKVVTGGENTGEPFVLGCPVGTDSIIAIDVTNTLEEVTFSICHKKEVVHHLDPKYIKDMYYTEEDESVEIFPMTTLTASEDNAGQFNAPIIGFVEGETYTLIWNGTTYESVAKKVSKNDVTAVGIGNSDVALGSGNTGEPFVVADVEAMGGWMIMDVDGLMAGNPMTKLTISIFAGKKGKIHKIDNKYIDAEWMATKTIGAGDVIYKDTYTEFSESSEGEMFTLFDPNETLTVEDELVIGKRYVVAENGVEYISKVRPYYYNQDINEKIVGKYLGNGKNITLDGVDTGEPFIIAFMGSASSYVTSTDTTNGITVTVSELAEVENKLPQEYLPEIPTFDLVEMGLPTVVYPDGVAEKEIDTTAIIETITNGMTAKFVINVDIDGNIVPVTLISNTFAYMAGSFQCGVILGTNISVSITIYPTSINVILTRLITAS